MGLQAQERELVQARQRHELYSFLQRLEDREWEHRGAHTKEGAQSVTLKQRGKKMKEHSYQRPPFLLENAAVCGGREV